MEPEQTTPVEDAARELANASIALEGARQALISQVHKHRGLGVSVSELARQANVQRATIYAWLEER